MGVIAIARSALSSQITRELMGDRTIDIFTSITTNESESAGGGLLSTIFGIGSRLAGFLVSVVGNFVGFLLRNLWDIIIEAAFEIVSFDWNQTDNAIRSQMESNNLQIFSALGGLAGTSTVWLASLGIAGLFTFKFPVVAGQVAVAIAREGGEEIRGQLQSFFSVSRNALTRNAVLGGFLTARRLRLFGMEPVENQREPWIIAEAVEERVEAIDDVRIRNFVEEFLESAVESLVEVGYVVSYTLDDYFSSNRIANNAAFGQQRGVILTPDNRIPDERVVLRGPQTLVQEQIQSVQAGHLWIHNRDVGQVVGQPAGDWIKAGIQRRRLTIVFKSKEKPPYVDPEGEGIKEVSVTIPHVDVGLTWERIKRAAKKWNWGKYRAVARLDNGRYLKCHGATEDEAEDKLRELLTLQDGEILTLSVTEEKDRHINLRKRSTMMYPAYATLVVRRAVSGDSGTTDASGQSYRQEHRRIELWPDSEPDNFEPLL